MSRVVVKVGGARRGGGGGARARAARRRPRGRASSTAPGRRSRRRWSGAGSTVAFVDGRRVTTPRRSRSCASRSPRVNAGLCAAIGRGRCASSATRSASRAVRSPELGLVGDPLPRRPAGGRRGARGRAGSRSSRRSRDGPLNVNADEAAAALAVGLGAERILFVTDVPGVLLDGAVVAAIARRRGRAAARRRRASRAGSSRSSRAAVGAARGGVRAEIGATAVRRMSVARRRSTRAACCRPTRAPDVTFVSRATAPGSSRRRRPALPRLRRPASPSSALGHCHPAPLAAAHAQLDRLWHVSNLYWTEPMLRARRAALRALRRRAGVLLQLRRRGERGGAEVRAQGDRQARHRRARGLVPRPHARRARGDRPAGEAGGVRAARPGRLASRG